MHVAIVTRGFPPIPHVSGKRPYYMARGLAARGHAVSVVCMDWRAAAPPGISAATAVIGAEDESAYDVRRIPPSARDRMHGGQEPARGFGARLGQKLESASRIVGWGPHPDWGQKACLALANVHAKRAVDVVWAIHGDPTSHEVAYRFARASGVPWVADFKDPWDLYTRGKLARALALHATRRRLRTASLLSETSAAQCAHDVERFGVAGHVVLSGYDPDAMARAVPRAANGAFSITYLGTTNGQHDVALFGRGLRRLRELRPDVADQLRVRIFSAAAGQLTDAIASAASGVVVEVMEPVGEAEAFREMRGASMLLLFPNRNTNVGVKELEYLASGTPVLSVGPLHAEMRRIVPATAPLMEASDELAVADCIIGQADQPTRARRSSVNPSFATQFSWEAQAVILEGVLEQARQRRARSHRPRVSPSTVAERIQR